MSSRSSVRDEGQPQLVEDLVGDLVAAVLELLDLLDDSDALGLPFRVEQGTEGGAGGGQVRDVLHEKHEELVLAREKLADQPIDSHVVPDPPFR